MNLNKEKVLSNLRIKPLVKGQLIQDPHPFNESYIWDPKFTSKKPRVQKVTTIIAQSEWSYYGLFKPSVGEVINSIPDEVLSKVDAFEISGEAKITGDTHSFEVTLYAFKESLWSKLVNLIKS